MGTPVDKICCVINHTGEMYKKIASNAVNSFKKYHPDIQLFEVTDDNIGDYHFSKNINFSIDGLVTEIDIGARKFFIAAELMKLRSYKKVICLGADTITSASNSKTIPPRTLIPPVTTVGCILVAAERDFRFLCILITSSRYCALVT